MDVSARLDPQQFLRRLVDQALALALLVPFLFLVWPGALSPIVGDPFPIPTGTGVAAVAATLVITLLITRRAKPALKHAWGYLGFALCGWIALQLSPPTDTFGASRGLLAIAVAVTALVGGASLGRDGGIALARGLVLLSLLTTLTALFDSEHGFSGALGNTGSTSEAALLGAAIGTWLALRQDGAWRWIGALAAAVYAFYVGAAPVLAGALSFAVVLVVLALSLRKERKLALMFALICGLLFAGGRIVPHAPLPASTRAAQNVPGDTGGLAVRKLVWGSLPPMIAAHGLLGAGHGQFQAAYPPFRDVREIELSTHERTLPQAETEVEHAHSDVLQGFVDAGWLGGLLWLAFLGSVGLAAWRALRTDEVGLRAPLGAAALGILANACLREPLLWNPASSSAAFALFGVLLAVEPPAAPGFDTWKRRGLVVLAIALVATNLARAWSIAWHGRAIAQYVATANPAFSQLALEVCEDSPVARATFARAVEAKSPPDEAEASVVAWKAVLQVRPHNIEALIQLATALARTDRGVRAIETLEHARTLDPGNKTVQLNLARMQALFGDVSQVDALLAASGADSRAAYRAYATSALRELRVERGFELLARVDSRYAKLGAELAYALGREADSPLDEEGRVALEGAAHALWARDHGANGRFDDALRSYRQAKRCLAPRDGRVPPLALSLEFAGACAAAGKIDEARAELGERELSAAQLARLPEWIGQALFENGLLAR